MTLWSRGLAWLRDKLKLLYLHYHIAYENKSWQDGNLPWWASAYKVACGLARSRDKLKPLHLYHNAYGHQTWQEGKLADGLLPIKPHDPSITWSCEITWQTKTIISPLPQFLFYGHQTWQNGNLPWLPPTIKITLSFDHTFLQDHVTT